MFTHLLFLGLTLFPTPPAGACTGESFAQLREPRAIEARLDGTTTATLKIMDSGVTTEDIERAKSALAAANRYRGTFHAPGGVTAELRSRDASYGHHKQTRTLSLLTRPAMKLGDKTLTKHPKYAAAAIAHEYGHDLFRETMLRAYPELVERFLLAQRKTAELSRRIDAEYAALSPLLGRIAKGMAGLKAFPTGSPEFREAWAALQPLRRQMGEHKQAIENLRHEQEEIGLAEIERDFSFAHLDALQELYGDAVAVAVTGDPSAMRKTVHFAGRKEATRKALANEEEIPKGEKERLARRDDRERDFAARPPRDDRYLRFGDSHDLYATARAELGVYFSSPRFRGKREAVMEALTEAMKEEIAHAAGTRRYFIDTAPADLNRNLMNRVRAKLGAP